MSLSTRPSFPSLLLLPPRRLYIESNTQSSLVLLILQLCGFADFSPGYSQTQTIQMSNVHLREKTSIHHNATKPAGRASCCRSGTKPNFTLQAWQWVTGLAHVYCSEIVEANVWMHKLECRTENYEGQPTNKTGNYASSVFQPLWQK